MKFVFDDQTHRAPNSKGIRPLIYNTCSSKELLGRLVNAYSVIKPIFRDTNLQTNAMGSVAITETGTVEYVVLSVPKSQSHIR